MKKRMVRVLTSAALTAAMVMSMGGMTAFAEESTKPTQAKQSIDIYKTLTSDGNTYAPNTAFKFKAVPGEGGEFISSGDGSKVEALPGVEGGLRVDDTGIVFTPGETVMEKTVTVGKDNGLLSIDSTKFTKTGIYHYVVSEIDNQYDGVIYDTNDVNVYLYVYEADDGSFYVGNVVANKKGADGKSFDVEFVNTYGADPEDPDEPDKVHDITIEKKVAGDFGEKNKPFDFEITVTGAEGEKYKAVLTSNKSEETTVTLESGSKAEIQLKDGETIQIYGLSENDIVNVSEIVAEEDGYNVSYAINNGDSESGNSVTDVKVVKDGEKIVFTNTKNAVTPTGIVMTFAPYVALIGLAGVFAATFLRKRREDF